MIMKPTNELRLKGTVLQQKWITTEDHIESSKINREEWKDVPKIEEEYNSTNDKPIIESGKWYVDEYESKFLLFTQKWTGKWSKDTFICYGFDFDGNWIYNSERDLLDMKEASLEYVKNRLFKEAIKRGFVKGAKFFGVQLNVNQDPEGECKKINENLFHYFHSDNGLVSGKNWIYKNGQWAEIIPQPEEKKYPTSVDEIEGRGWLIENHGKISNGPAKSISITQLSSKSRAKAILALTQLVELRDAWNKVDGFVVDWLNDEQYKFLIELNIKLELDKYKRCSHHTAILHFGSAETRDKFLETFRPLIEEAKEFL